MAQGFSITSRIGIANNIENIGPVVSKLKKAIDSASKVNLRIDNNRLNAQLSAITAQSNRLTSSLDKVGERFARMRAEANNIRPITSALKDSTTAANNFGKALQLSGRRLSAYIGASAAIYGLINGFRSGIREAISFESAVNKIGQTAGKSLTEIQPFTKAIQDVARELGVAQTLLAKSAQSQVAAGFSTDLSKQLTKLVAQTQLSPSFDGGSEKSIETVNNLLIQLRENFRFGDDVALYEKALNSVANVSDQTAVSSIDLSQALGRAGSTAKQTSTSIQELTSLAATLGSVTRQSGSVVGNSLKSILQKLSNPANIKRLRETLGVELQNSDGSFVGGFEGLKRLSAKTKEFQPGDIGLTSEITEVFGGFQSGRAIAILQNFDTAEKNLGIALQDTSRLSQQAAQAQDTLAVKSQKTAESFNQLFSTLLNNKGIRDLIELSLNAGTSISTLATHASKLAPILLGLGAFAGGKAIGSALGKFGNISLPTLSRDKGVTASSGMAVNLGGSPIVNGWGVRRAEPLKSIEGANIAADSARKYGAMMAARTIAEAKATQSTNLFTTAIIKASQSLPGLGGALIGRNSKVNRVATGASFATLTAGQFVGGPTGEALSNAGFVGTALGAINPMLGAFTAVTTGVLSFNEALEKSRKEALAEGNQRFTDNLSNLGALHKTTLDSLTNEVAKSQAFGKQGVGGLQSYLRSVSNVFKGDFANTNPLDAETQIKKERRDAIAQDLRANEQQFRAVAEAITSKVTNIDQFKAFQGGVGQKLLDAFDMMEDGIINGSSTFEEATKKTIANAQAQIVATKAATELALTFGKTALGISQTARNIEADIPRAIQSILDHQSLLSDFSGLNQLGTRNFAEAASRLPLTNEQSKVVSEVNRATAIIPDILKRIGGSLTSDTFKDTLANEIRGSGFSREFTDTIINNLGDFDTFSDSLKKDLQATSDTLLQAFNPTIDGVRRIGSAIQAAEKATLERIGRGFDIASEIRQSQLGIALGNLNIENTRRGFRGQTPIVGGEQQAINQFIGSVPKLKAQTEALIQEFQRTKDARLSFQIQDNVARLKELSQVSSQLAGAIQANISAEQQSLNAKTSLIEQFYSGSIKDRFSMVRDIGLTQQVYNSKAKITDLGPQQQAILVKTLSGPLAQIKNLFGSGKTGRELLNDVLGVKSLPEQKKIDELQEELITAMTTEQDARKALLDIQTKLQIDYFNQLSKRDSQFFTDLEFYLFGGKRQGFNQGGRVRYYATGGYVSKGTDTIPAMLTKDEYVINRKAAIRNRGLLDAINNGKDVNEYATGGSVSQYQGYHGRAKRRAARHARGMNGILQRRLNAANYSATKLYGKTATELEQLPAIQQLRKSGNTASIGTIAKYQNNPGFAFNQKLQRYVPVKKLGPQVLKTPKDYNPFIKGFASGGFVNPQDNRLALVQDGEFIVRKGIAQRNHGMLTSLNSGGSVKPTNNPNLKPLSLDIKALAGLDGFSRAVSNLGIYTERISKLKIPERIEVSGNHKHEHVFNGVGLVNAMFDRIKEYIDENTDKRIMEFINPIDSSTKSFPIAPNIIHNRR